MQELALLEKLTPADERWRICSTSSAAGVHAAAIAGCMIKLPTASVMWRGRVPTQDHFLAGQVLPDSYDIEGRRSRAGGV
jgi:hypothetical protein